ncbi:hypothetical protein [Anoxybacillus flavithermus]|uniref:Uncharacterized conserved protein n=1 Tax=Anoxybacillus flavithermus (strain DSM 21510 / WK1) TaxID=491915 RepID=B7GJE0_ANOFW|nr:hypothetical protein [Anoxybacillus flavithermus]ACJ33588.1 Uncharacterized conserved protein [Anoxybacillus flavithermus WK1]
MSTWSRIESGIKQGLKDVAASYGIDWIGMGNTASKVGSATVGARNGWREAKTEVRIQISQAETRLAAGKIEKAAAQTMAKGAAKGAMKAIGIWGFIPDIAIFANGFRKGYSAAGN